MPVCGELRVLTNRALPLRRPLPRFPFRFLQLYAGLSVANSSGADSRGKPALRDRAQRSSGHDLAHQDIAPNPATSGARQASTNESSMLSRTDRPYLRVSSRTTWRCAPARRQDGRRNARPARRATSPPVPLERGREVPRAGAKPATGPAGRIRVLPRKVVPPPQRRSCGGSQSLTSVRVALLSGTSDRLGARATGSSARKRDNTDRRAQRLAPGTFAGKGCPHGGSARVTQRRGLRTRVRGGGGPGRRASPSGPTMQGRDERAGPAPGREGHGRETDAHAALLERRF